MDLLDELMTITIGPIAIDRTERVRLRVCLFGTPILTLRRRP